MKRLGFSILRNLTILQGIKVLGQNLPEYYYPVTPRQHLVEKLIRRQKIIKVEMFTQMSGYVTKRKKINGMISRGVGNGIAK